MDSTLLTIGLLLTAIGTAFSLYQGYKKAPFDIRKLLLDNKKMEVELADKYEAQLDKMSMYNLHLRNEIQDVRTKMDEMATRHSTELTEIKTRYEGEMAEIRAALSRTEKRAQLVEDWAARLCSQVESLGETPVPFELKHKTIPRKD